MDRGDLVPDDVIVDMVLERLGEGDCDGGFVLDGFPRTVAQAEALEERLDKLGRPLDAVVSLEVGKDELRHRLAHRAEEQDRAEDDDEDAIRRRLELFHHETGPLLDFYGDKGLLARVPAEGDPGEVADQIAAALDGRGGRDGREGAA
jgi:adenylate kinase